ncbi:MAG: 3-oxo-5-alpha-steroid 4-dehydrogenase [Bacteroidales bacterium]|jgi:protein-S-isoprenylcysteine O-methyltransferase Ste14
MKDLYDYSMLMIFGFAVLVFLVLFFISAPYGKFSRKGWGPAIRAKWAWLLMESPSPLLMALFFTVSGHKGIATLIFLACWLAHYVHRTFIYPFRQSGREKPYPVLLVAMALLFNFLNGFVNGYGVFNFNQYPNSWLLSWQFIIGIVLFAAGFSINKEADEKLRGLRRTNPSEYVIPRGWLFNYISSPHYFGEMIEWGGWALMTWSLAGFAFFLFTVANLFPRAILSHKWYKSSFHDYPEKRKAIIPFIL